MRFHLIAGKGRATGDFMKALRQHRTAFNVLLIDSEGPDDGRLLEQLRCRRDWQPPGGEGVAADQVYWMVQLMESWFIADRAALRRFYGNGFHEAALPANPEVERIPKLEVLDGLRAATRNSTKRTYHKTAHAPSLLTWLKPARVRAAAPHCE